MLIHHLFEAIHETLATESRDILLATLNKWTKEIGVPSVKHFFSECAVWFRITNPEMLEDMYKHRNCEMLVSLGMIFS